MIKLENLTKTFSQKNGTLMKAVDNVSLEVPAGEMCVLLGPSGCGKTTTLKMINRLIPATSGRILINGEDTNTRTRPRCAAILATLFSKLVCFLT